MFLSILFLVIASLSLGAFAGKAQNNLSRGRHRQYARTVEARNSNSSKVYTLQDMYQGKSFLKYVSFFHKSVLGRRPFNSIFSDWDFFTAEDPTHGSVRYRNRADATAKGLAFVQKDGTTILAVDDKTSLPVGAKRDSYVLNGIPKVLSLKKLFRVRISTKKKYNGGLFIADFFAMPHGCSVWPAYW
jgi:hypothetical protein